MVRIPQETNFILCIENRDCYDLEKGKVYSVLPDAPAKGDGYLRVIDESGEDYLYPASCFIAIDLPDAARVAFGRG